MKKVLFENHHLYYLPNFIPIIEEMNRRGGYEIFSSIPAHMPQSEQSTFFNGCDALGIETIRSDDEQNRIQSIREKSFDVVIVGNVGQLNEIVTTSTLAVMVYHGIGLKQSYYNDIDPRIDLRAVESESRLAELKSHGHSNLTLTGFTKCDPLVLDENEIELNTIGLNPNQKTVLYAPSFYPTSLDQFLPILGKLSYETNIIVKLHNFSWYQNRYLYQSKAVQKLADEFEHIDDKRGGKFKIKLLAKISKCGAITPRFKVKKDEYGVWEQQFLPSYDKGMLLVTTNQGVMSHKEAVDKNIGGFLIGYVY